MDVTKEIIGLTEWIKDYVDGAGKKGVVIGLSGGVDSAVSFELAIRALGKENVLAVSLPILANTDEEYGTQTDMWKYAFESRGVEHQTIQCSGVAMDFLSALKKPNYEIFSDESNTPSSVSRLTYANIQARIRMTMLYAMASERDYLVIGTGNKSEHAIGYFTKWGDGAVDFEPLGDYYKDEVYELARELNVPKSIINVAPSAGLWEGQTDEGELGVTYKALDAFLRWDEQSDYWKHENVCPLGGEKLERVKGLMSAARHKNHLPQIYLRD